MPTKSLDIEIEMICSPNKWPLWPILPLIHRKRNHDNPHCLGFLVPSEGEPYKVYLGTIYEAGNIADLASEEYPTVEALCSDWRVD